MRRGRVIAFEALARWNSPELGAVAPNLFIPIAERSQMIGRVTEILLERALNAARYWPGDIGLCFNLSAQDLMTVETMNAVRNAVLAAHIAPARIAFEVTETALLPDFEQAVRAIESLRALGTRIALDDFGTGYSSLGYVQRLPLDKIKIDRSFIADVDIHKTSANIVKSIIDLCRNLDIVCVVEGVETESQLRAITALGCNFIQGYLLSQPVPGDAVTRLIDQIAAHGWAVDKVAGDDLCRV
jgi:predicted signal transduction protein with EAL and GGDEF domain